MEIACGSFEANLITQQHFLLQVFRNVWGIPDLKLSCNIGGVPNLKLPRNIYGIDYLKLSRKIYGIN